MQQATCSTTFPGFFESPESRQNPDFLSMMEVFQFHWHLAVFLRIVGGERPLFRRIG
jgi:hypothetical protein